jgi:hypothetical protein
LIGLTVAQDGVYIAKNNEYTIQKYDFNDKLQYRFGEKGEGRGQFKSVTGLAVAKDRQVIVADAAKGTTTEVDNAEGNYLDMTNLTLDQKEQYLFFVNKTDGTLWSLSIVTPAPAATPAPALPSVQ